MEKRKSIFFDRDVLYKRRKFDIEESKLEKLEKDMNEKLNKLEKDMNEKLDKLEKDMNEKLERMLIKEEINLSSLKISDCNYIS